MTLNIDSTIMIVENFISDNIIIIMVIIALIFVSSIIAKINSKKRKNNLTYEKPHNDPILINQNIDNKEFIEQEAFRLLTELKLAKMDYDLDKIKQITNNNIFDLYKRQIETLKNKQQKNIVEKIKHLKSYITKENDKTVNLRIMIECYDFVIDQNNNLIKGKYNAKVMQNYEIEITLYNSNYIIQKLELIFEREI